MARLEHVCTDLSHPPIIHNTGQKTLYQQVLEAVTNHGQKGLSRDEVVYVVASELIPRLTAPSAHYTAGFMQQEIRRGIARDWKHVFTKLENIGYLTGWFINECTQERDAGELHHVLCNMAFESNRNLFAVVNQLRSGLPNDTFGYLRTLHETFVKSHFLKKHAKDDPDLPGRFLCHTNATYLAFYRQFADIYGANAAESMWVETEQKCKSRFPNLEGKGDYGWAYPLIKKKNGEPKLRPIFRDLMDEVDVDSDFGRAYYDISTSKTHGELIWNSMMVFPYARELRFDSFTSETIGLVIDLMLPLFEGILENTAPSCTSPKHAVVMSIVKAIIENVRDSVTEVKASDPQRHLGIES